LATATFATLVFVWLMTPLPQFMGAGRSYLLYYHAPIGFAFVTFLFDRAQQWPRIQ
jgi:hypothetical protein